jgi:hypothetical protein
MGVVGLFVRGCFCLNQDLRDIRDFQDGPLRVGVVGLFVRSCFCLNQDLRDIRDFQDGRLIVCGRFSGSVIGCCVGLMFYIIYRWVLDALSLASDFHC